jgi:hypothetical protein
MTNPLEVARDLPPTPPTPRQLSYHFKTALLALAFAAILHASARADSFVEIQSSNPDVMLEQITAESHVVANGPGGTASASGRQWQPVCRTPCKASVPTDSYYFVDGPGITRSRKLLLPDGPVRLDVDPGASWQFWGGIAGLSIGGGLALTGGALLASKFDGPGKPLIIIGAPLAIGGLVMALHGRTTVDVVRIGRTSARLDARRGAIVF